MYGEISLPDISWRDGNPSGYIKTHAWIHTVPYIMEPRNETARKYIKLVLCAYFKMKLERKLRDYASLGEAGSHIGLYETILDYEIRRYRQLGGGNKLIFAPSFHEIRSTFSGSIKDFHTVYSTILFLLRLADDKSGKVWPSLKQARGLVSACNPAQGSSISPYRSQKDIDRVFSQWKPVAHLIFGLIHNSSNPTILKPGSISDIMRCSLYAQGAITKISLRNTDFKTAYGPGELWELPSDIGPEPEKLHIKPITQPEIDAFCINVNKGRKNPAKVAGGGSVTDSSLLADDLPPSSRIEAAHEDVEPPSLEQGE